MTSGFKPRSIGALVLMREDASLRELASLLFQSPSYVSRQLSDEQRPYREFLDALKRYAGAEGADEIAADLGTQRNFERTEGPDSARSLSDSTPRPPALMRQKRCSSAS